MAQPQFTPVWNDKAAQLVQIHGAPQSAADDVQLMDVLENIIKTASNTRLALLIHRPDEVQILHPNFRHVIEKSDRLHLVFLGDHHVNDPFYDFKSTRIQVSLRSLYIEINSSMSC